MDYDTYSANDPIGRIYVDVNCLIDAAYASTRHGMQFVLRPTGPIFAQITRTRPTRTRLPTTVRTRSSSLPAARMRCSRTKCTVGYQYSTHCWAIVVMCLLVYVCNSSPTRIKCVCPVVALRSLSVSACAHAYALSPDTTTRLVTH